MAQEFGSLSARLGGALGRGLSGAAEGISDIVTERIARLQKQQDIEKQRGQEQKFLESILPADQRGNAQALSYAAPEERRDFLKALYEQQQRGAFQDYLQKQGLMENLQAGAPQELMGEQQPQIQPPTAAQERGIEYLPKVAEKFKEGIPQPTPVEEQKPVYNMLKDIFGHGLSAQMQDVMKPMNALFKTPVNPEKFAQDIGNAPIKPQANKEEQMRLATTYAALNEMVNKQNEIPIESPKDMAPVLAAQAVVQGKPGSLSDIFRSGGISPTEYIHMQNLALNLDKEGRQWTQKKIEEVQVSGKRGKMLLDNIDDAEAMINSGARMGGFSRILSGMGIDPVAFSNTPTQLLSKVLNELVLNSDGFNSSRSTNLSRSTLMATKPSVLNTPEAAKAIMIAFRKAGEAQVARDEAQKKLLDYYESKGLPLPKNFNYKVDQLAEPKIAASAKIAKDALRKAGINVSESTSGDDIIDVSNFKVGGKMEFSDMPEGTVFKDNGKTYRKENGKRVSA